MFYKIKKQNGERFAKAIRAYDNGIFDIENLDKILKYAGRSAESIMNYLVSLKNIKIEEYGVYKHPIDLLNKAGYDAFYVETLEQQNSIKKYYALGEEICTFRDENRYKNYHIIHCVSKNVDKIKRKNHPQREDEYGTSVMSIQILKEGGFISIKNRYNNNVKNPDNTLNSNPDNIIQGLSEALKHTYNVDFSSLKVKLPKNYIEINGQLIKYNIEIDNIYCGNTFYIQNGEIHEINKADELMLDNFILNWKTNEIKNTIGQKDTFINALNQEIKDKNLQVIKNKEGNKCLMADGYKILELNNGQIVKLDFPNVTEIGNEFLVYNRKLEELKLSNVESIGKSFMPYNHSISSADLPKLKEINDWFLVNNSTIKEIKLPKIEKIGNDFLLYNQKIKEIDFPYLKSIGDKFLHTNISISKVNLPKVKKIGKEFLYSNVALKEIKVPNAKDIGSYFLVKNYILEKINIKNAEKIGDKFLVENKNLKYFIGNIDIISDKLKKTIKNNNSIKGQFSKLMDSIRTDMKHISYASGVKNKINIASEILKRNFKSM